MNRYYKFIQENPRKYALFPLIAYWLLIFTLTTIPGNYHIDRFHFSDKVKHFLAFYFLTFFYIQFLIFYKRKIKISHLFFLSFTILTLYAGFDEIHQMYVPYRSADIYDFLADFFGICLGFVTTAIIFLNYIKKK